MDRETLISQVKNEYANLADLESRSHFVNAKSYGNTSPEAFYERRLEMVIKDITDGKYDHCSSGLEVVEMVANNKPKSERICDHIESTLHNMEIAEEFMMQTTDQKEISELLDKNQRRAQAVSSMIKEAKEEQAKEQLDSAHPNVVGGGGKQSTK